MRKRLDRIDALRGVAAVSVVVSHSFDKLSADNSWRVGTTFFNAGYFGVSIFFLISGFLITLSILRVPLHDFWVRRVFRLYPAFWVSLIGAVFIHHTDISVLQIVANATMVPQLFGQPLLLLTYWTLGVEMLFYVMMSLLVMLNRIHYVCLITLLLLGIGLLTDHLLPYTVQQPLGVTSVWTASNLALLFTGAWIGQIWQGVRPGRVDYLLISTLWASHILFGAVTGNGAWMLTRLLAGVVFVLVLRSSWQPPRLFLLVGSISYSLYLVHDIIIQSISITQPLMATATWVIVSCATAYVLYNYIERPSIYVGSYIMSRWKVE